MYTVRIVRVIWMRMMDGMGGPVLSMYFTLPIHTCISTFIRGGVDTWDGLCICMYVCMYCRYVRSRYVQSMSTRCSALLVALWWLLHDPVLPGLSTGQSSAPTTTTTTHKLARAERTPKSGPLEPLLTTALSIYRPPSTPALLPLQLHTSQFTVSRPN
jgi:hypothetical protein